MKSRDGNMTVSPHSQSNFGLTLHMDQQNLILGEMINTRNRLQEENQELRDSLQDAEMVIRLLHMKLEKERAANRQQQKGKSRHEKEASSSPLKSRNFDWRSKRVLGKARAYNKKAFLNVVAPGKRTFEPPNATSKIVKSTSDTALTWEHGNPSPRRRRPTESPGKRRPKTVETSSTPSPSRRRSQVKDEAPYTSTTTESPVRRRPDVVVKASSKRSPGCAKEPTSPSRTTIGKLVDEVIHEYSSLER